jgi:hypothetical protein
MADACVLRGKPATYQSVPPRRNVSAREFESRRNRKVVRPKYRRHDERVEAGARLSGAARPRRHWRAAPARACKFLSNQKMKFVIHFDL